MTSMFQSYIINIFLTAVMFFIFICLNYWLNHQVFQGIMIPILNLYDLFAYVIINYEDSYEEMVAIQIYDYLHHEIQYIDLNQEINHRCEFVLGTCNYIVIYFHNFSSFEF